MDPRALKFWSQLAEFGPETGSPPHAQAEPAAAFNGGRDARPREWVVEFDEPRLSPGQTGFLAHMIGQVIGAAQPKPSAHPYARRTLRPGIAFDRKA